MAVRDALLSILTIGPAYGFQLHGELAARTGGRRVINVGQTYATLDRLGERGLIASAGTTDDGLPLHGLTDAGRVAAMGWLHGTDAPVSDPWDETVERVLVAASLPGIDVRGVIAAERDRWRARHEAAHAAAGGSALVATPAGIRASRPDGASATAGAAGLVTRAAALDAARAAALLDWLDAVASDPPASFGFSEARPKRGRRPSAQPTESDEVTAASARRAQAASA